MLSSPTIHQAYLSVRQQVLSCILQTQHGELFGEAIAVVRSHGLFFENRKEEAIALLDTWRRREEISELASAAPRTDKPNIMDEVLALCRLEKELLFFLKDYTINLSRPWWIKPDH